MVQENSIPAASKAWAPAKLDLPTKWSASVSPANALPEYPRPQGVARIFLNNQYTYNNGVLDLGFWPDGIYTAPTDEALKFDVEARRRK